MQKNKVVIIRNWVNRNEKKRENLEASKKGYAKHAETKKHARKEYMLKIQKVRGKIENSLTPKI